MASLRLLIAAVLVASACGCQDASRKYENSKLLGKWAVVERDGWPLKDGTTLTLEFLADGKLIVEETEIGMPASRHDGTFEHHPTVLITRQASGDASWIIDSITDTEAVLRQEMWEGRDQPVPGRPTRLKRI